MKAFSLIQPYATLIIDGHKEFETRSWPTPYRGLVAIHASKGMSAGDREALETLTEDYPEIFRDLAIPRGAVLGIAELVDCLSMTSDLERSISEQEHDFGYWSAGRFAWKMRIVEKFAEPIPAKGMLGLWEWAPPAEVVGRLRGEAQ